MHEKFISMEEPQFQEIRALLSKSPWGTEMDLNQLDLQQIANGNINRSFFLIEKSSGETKYVLQKLHTIFDLKEVNKNLQLFEEAQDSVRETRTGYWQEVHYLSVSGSEDKIFVNGDGTSWRVMEFIEGEIFDSFEEVTEKFGEEGRGEIAHALGEGIVMFGQMVNTIPAEKWGKPLPNYHNTQYHYNYLQAILNEEQLPLSLSRDQVSTVSINKEFYEKYSERIETLRREFENQQELVLCSDESTPAIAHNDLKINNAVFRKGPNNRWHCVAFIDLDTIQLGTVLDDLGDALRSAGNPVGEEPLSPDQVTIDRKIVDAIISGYQERVGVGAPSRSSIIQAYKKYHYELALRFFADSLVGNKYFRLSPGVREDLNLYRAEVQMRALKEIQRIY